MCSYTQLNPNQLNHSADDTPQNNTETFVAKQSEVEGGGPRRSRSFPVPAQEGPVDTAAEPEEVGGAVVANASVLPPPPGDLSLQT